MKAWQRWWILALCGACAAARAAGAAGLPGPLVGAQWLHEHLDEVTVLTVADGDQTSLYTAAPRLGADHAVQQVGGHIPGSLLLDFGSIRQSRVEDGQTLQALLPEAGFFGEAMDKAGLRTSRPVVIAALGDGVNALDMGARVYFQLRYFGQPREAVALLNGGTAAWLQAGYAVSTAAAPTARGDWKPGRPDAAILATLEQVRQGLDSGAVQFIDARPTPQYLGIEQPPIDRSAGHLPGAKSFPTDAIVATRDGVTRFLTARDYEWMFANYDISTHAPTITYCNTGQLASGAWFVAREILGNRQARMYANSMNEWTHLGHPTVGLPEEPAAAP